MPTTEWAWLIDQIGKPIPCHLCRTPRSSSELKEITVPGVVIFDGTVVVDTVQWVCADGCPVGGDHVGPD